MGDSSFFVLLLGKVNKKMLKNSKKLFIFIIKCVIMITETNGRCVSHKKERRKQYEDHHYRKTDQRSR